jgi:hypothetical protein
MTQFTGISSLRGVGSLRNGEAGDPVWTMDFTKTDPWPNGSEYNFFSQRTAGTFVDSDGFVTNSPNNLMLSSENLANTNIWVIDPSSSNMTTTRGATFAPDGSNTAVFMNEGLGGDRHLITQTFSSTDLTLTASVYLKEGNRRYGYVRLIYNDNVGIIYPQVLLFVDLRTGMIVQRLVSSGSYGLNDTARWSSTPVGNGWHRLSVTLNRLSSFSSQCFFNIGISDTWPPSNVPSYDVIPYYFGTNNLGLYAWGAQVVRGNKTLPYTATEISNLVARSQELTSNEQWVFNNGLTSLANSNDTVSPTGITNAEAFYEASTGGNEEHRIGSGGISVDPNNTYTISLYMKKGLRDHAALSFFNSGSIRGTQVFDLANGTTGSMTSAGLTFVGSSIVNAGNGWYRGSVTVVSPNITSTGFRFGSSNSATPVFSSGGMPSFTGSNAAGAAFYAWGAQMVRGVDALPYAPTTNTDLYRVNAPPRYMHSANGQRMGLLIEEQRTNRLAYSQDSYNDTNVWTNTGISAAAVAQIVAPNGASAQRLMATGAASSQHNLRRSASSPHTGMQVVSAYLKAGTGVGATFGWIGGDSSSGVYAMYNLVTGTLTDLLVGTNMTGASAAYQGLSAGNGWWRFWTRAETLSRIFIGMSNGPTFPANGVVSFVASQTGQDVMYAWGAQVEAGWLPSSYIPTTTAAVTRAADIAFIADSKIQNWSQPGTLYVEFHQPGQNGTIMTVGNSVTGNSSVLGFEQIGTTGSPRVDLVWELGSGTADSSLTGYQNDNIHRVAFSFVGASGATASWSHNGVARDLSISTNFNPSVSEILNLGSTITNSAYTKFSNVIIRKVAFYNKALTQTDINTLTR